VSIEVSVMESVQGDEEKSSSCDLKGILKPKSVMDQYIYVLPTAGISFYDAGGGK
jgi:hypothetical protein